MRIQEHISLKELTTMKVGGIARYFCSVKKVGELSEALAFAREKKIGFSVLGGGSNTLIANGNIDALIIKIDIKGIEWREGKDILTSRNSDILKSQNLKISKSQNVLVIAGAGESWDGLVAKAVRRGLWGVENLSGIPGTVGAAPVQNIGAYGAEIKETLAWVEIFDTESGKFRTLLNKACEFGYRDSIFKRPEGKRFIIMRVALRLKRNGRPNLEYKDLKERFRIYDLRFVKGKGEETLGHPVLADIRKAVLEIRSNKFPDLREFGTAGSFFKNPIISQEQFAALKKKFPDLPGFEVSLPRSKLTANSYKLKAIKVPLAWVLDNICGLKGYARGNVRLFERQPIVLVQNGSASFEEIEAFAKEITERVKKKTGIEIEFEVQRIR